MLIREYFSKNETNQIIIYCVTSICIVIFGKVHNLHRMLKRIFPIALLTGSGQLFSLFALKYVSRLGSSLDLKAIGQTDSLVLFILNGIALGLQTASMRDLALATDWRQDYHNTQSARLTLSLLLSAGALFAFFNTYYLLFLFAPILAMNGDYALYARSYPIIGAAIGFSRLFLPYGAIVIAAHYRPDQIVPAYILATVLIYFLSNFFITWFLKTPSVAKPSLKNLHLYIKSLPLGIVVLSLYFIGLGLMMIIPYFYSNPIIAVTYVGLKFYVLFKGVLRIIHQAFIREMNAYSVCFKVDQLTSLAGLAFATFTLCFPATFIKLFFGEIYLTDKMYFILLSVAGLVYSVFSSFIIKAMLEKKDIPYAVGAFLSAILTIALSIVWSFYHQQSVYVGISLLMGEILFAAAMIFILNRRGLLQERLVFFVKNLPVVIIPFLISYFTGDVMKGFLISAVLFIIAMAAIHYRKFTFPVITTDNES